MLKKNTKKVLIIFVLTFINLCTYVNAGPVNNPNSSTYETTPQQGIWAAGEKGEDINDIKERLNIPTNSNNGNNKKSETNNLNNNNDTKTDNSDGSFSISKIFDQASDWINDGKQNVGQTMDTAKLKNGIDVLFNLGMLIGVAVVVIVGLLLGIKYMTAGLSEKVQVKQSLIPYFISSAILFGSYGIWKVSVLILSNF